MTHTLVPLGELCDVDRRLVRPSDPDAARLPFVGVEHVAAGSGDIDLDSGSRVGSQKSAAFHFDPRHVLYGKLRPYLNKVATPAFAGRCSTELVPLLPREGIDRSFLAHLLRRRKSVDFVMASVTGARMPRTDMKLLMSMEVPFLPLEEQRKIAAILNRAANIERLRGQASESLRELAPAMFVKMFGDPLRNPKRWSVRKVGDVCLSARYGTSEKPSGEGEGVPVIRMGNVTYDGHLDCADLKTVVLADAEAAKHALRPGDILFNRTNSKELVGKTGMWDGRFPAVAASYFIRLRLDTTYAHPAYVWAFMNSASVKQRLLGMARGAIGQANINAREVKSLPFPVPPIQHQHRFARIVEQADRVSDLAAPVTDLALTESLVERLFTQFELTQDVG